LQVVHALLLHVKGKKKKKNSDFHKFVIFEKGGGGAFQHCWKCISLCYACLMELDVGVISEDEYYQVKKNLIELTA
jgi:hypothetical protein